VLLQDTQLRYVWRFTANDVCENYICKNNLNDVAIGNSYRRLQAECRKLTRGYEIKREVGVINANKRANFIHLLMVKWLVPVVLEP